MRLGVAADGNPIIYARSEAVADKVAKAVQNQTKVHVRTIPELTKEQFRVLGHQAASALLTAPEPAPKPKGRKR